MFENVSAEMLGNIYVGLLGLSVLLYAILVATTWVWVYLSRQEQKRFAMT